MIARIIQARNILARFITSRPIIANDSGGPAGDFAKADFASADFF